MCGIAGYILNKNIKNKKNLDIHLLRMTDALKHRGPDACGYWKDMLLLLMEKFIILGN